MEEQGCLTGFAEVRHPYNDSDSRTDFVGKDSTGSKICIDLKAIDGSGFRPMDRHTQDINRNIRDLFAGA